MTSRTTFWIATHVAAVAVAYGVTRATGPGGPGGSGGNETAGATKLSYRDMREEEQANAALLADFVEAHRDSTTPEKTGTADATAAGLEERLRGFQAQAGNAGRPPQDVVNDFVYGELGRLLSEGRDWRFEFRHGKATLEEVVAAVREGLPGVPTEGEEALTVTLFRQLVEEDREKAMPLLDGLTEEKRREALFHSTWLSQVNIDPGDFLDFCRHLPEPVENWEKDLRTKGWNWKARGFLMRYGDDYVEWVKEMPEGLDKETAMNSLIWATREQNPAEARRLSNELFPPKPE